MITETSTWTNREKAIILGLFLSKFDKEALNILGFKSFREAFNVSGFSLKIKPMSIKNYRDEFDPYFINSRIGRQSRPMRPNCKLLYDLFKDYEFENFTKLILHQLEFEDELQDFGAFSNNSLLFENTIFAKRLITGEAAEEYFRQKYKDIEVFEGFELIDTTKKGCGFDFKLKKKELFWGIEVKGLSGKSGNISMTEKEFNVAKLLRHQYYLFVVKNFQEMPFHEYFVDPINSELNFVCHKTVITQSTWNIHL